MMFLFICLLLLDSLLAFPDFERCNLDTWVADGPFNQFGIATYTKGGDDCVISGVPASFAPCDIVTVTLTSKIDFGHKLAVSAGTLGSAIITTTKQKENCRHSSENKQQVTTYSWTAPPDETASVNFGGLCGDMLTNAVLFAADQIISVRDPNGTIFQGGCPLDANAEEEPPSTNTAQLIQENIPLLLGIAGVVVVGLALAAFFAYRRHSAAQNVTEKVTEKLEGFQTTVKQRMQSMRPGSMTGFSRMRDGGGNNGAQDVTLSNQIAPTIGMGQQQRYGGNMGGGAADGVSRMAAQMPAYQYNQSPQYNQAAQYQQYQASQYQQQQQQQQYQAPQYGYQMPGQYSQQYSGARGGGQQQFMQLSSSNPAFRQY